MKNNKDKFSLVVKEYFDENIPEPEQSSIEMLKQHLREYEPVVNNETKPKQTKKFDFQLIITMVASFLALVISLLSTILVVVNNSGNNQNVPSINYYGDDDVEYMDYSREFIQQYINQKYFSLGFIFEDFNIDESFGYKLKNTETAVAFNLKLNKKDFPNTIVQLNVILDNKYIFARDNEFRKNANEVKFEKCTLYTKEVSTPGVYSYNVLIEYENEKFYLVMDILDQEILNKFLNL